MGRFTYSDADAELFRHAAEAGGDDLRPPSVLNVEKPPNEDLTPTFDPPVGGTLEQEGEIIDVFNALVGLPLWAPPRRRRGQLLDGLISFWEGCPALVRLARRIGLIRACNSSYNS